MRSLPHLSSNPQALRSLVHRNWAHKRAYCFATDRTLWDHSFKRDLYTNGLPESSKFMPGEKNILSCTCGAEVVMGEEKCPSPVGE